MSSPEDADDELDELGPWAGPPRGTHHPKEDWPEDEAIPPPGPPGVSSSYSAPDAAPA